MNNPKRQFTPAELQYIKETYALSGGKGSISQIVRQLHSSDLVVRRTLIELGVKIKTKEESATKLSADFGFFDSIDTEEKAYWLGFMYADGSIKRRNYVQLALVEPEPLEAFKSALSAEHPVKREKNDRGKFNKPTDVMYFLRIGNARLARALLAQGCLAKKPARVFPTPQQVPSALLPHFVRGLFDGDGSLYYNTGKNKVYGALSIHPLLGVGLIQHLHDVLGIELAMHNDKTIKCITFCYDKLRVVLDYMYKNCTVALARKKGFYDAVSEGRLRII